jgi:murein L,D-transpeptidase YcbB/YkuD
MSSLGSRSRFSLAILVVVLAAMAGRGAAAATAQRTVLADRPVAVFVAYYTAWVAANGSVQFREDLYRRDGRLVAALRRLD